MCENGLENICCKLIARNVMDGFALIVTLIHIEFISMNREIYSKCKQIEAKAARKVPRIFQVAINSKQKLIYVYIFNWPFRFRSK